jgi:hypothetical protein
MRAVRNRSDAAPGSGAIPPDGSAQDADDAIAVDNGLGDSTATPDLGMRRNHRRKQKANSETPSLHGNHGMYL